MNGTLTRERNILEEVVARKSFDVFVEALKAANLAETLVTSELYTVFVPTDYAFAQFCGGTTEGLLDDPWELVDILKYHIVPGKFRKADLREFDSVKTLLGQDLAIGLSDGVRVDDVEIVESDIDCSNGTLHVINTVLLPK